MAKRIPKLMQHDSAISAIRVAVAMAPAAVGWKTGGWVVYDPRLGAPEGVEPEMLIVRQRALPIPLSDTGAEVIRSALIAKLIG